MSLTKTANIVSENTTLDLVRAYLLGLGLVLKEDGFIYSGTTQMYQLGEYSYGGTTLNVYVKSLQAIEFIPIEFTIKAGDSDT